jgi:hypothetical protein
MPDNSPIIAQPNPLVIATGVEGLLEIGGSVLYQGKPQGFIKAADYDIEGIVIDETNGYMEKIVAGDWFTSHCNSRRRTPANQPLWVHAGFHIVQAFHQEILVGVVDDLGHVWFVGAYSNAFDSGGWHYYVYKDGVVVVGGVSGITVSPGDKLAVYVDGQTITAAIRHSNIWRNVYSEPIPADSGGFRSYYNLNGLQTALIDCQTRIDDAIVNLTTDIAQFRFLEPDHFFTERIVDATHYGISASAVDEVIAEISVPNLDVPVTPVNVQLRSEPLYIRPVSGVNCGGTVIQGDIIQFETNGGLGGVFEASIGTVLSGLRWQAPFIEGTAVFTFTVGGITAQCELLVVRRLTVEGVDEDGYYPDLAQGESVTFIASCHNVEWFSDPPFLVVRRSANAGKLHAPTDAIDSEFGEKQVTVTVRGCGQEYKFKVLIQAMYPTPRFCGATPTKWSQDEPDFLPTRLTMVGGTSQVKNRTAVGIRTWSIEYDILRQDATTTCNCENQGDPATHVPSCTNDLATAKRLSDFYKKVKQTRYFTVVDYHTGEQFKYVRLTHFERAHTLYKTEQARRVSLRWEGDNQISSGFIAEDCQEGGSSTVVTLPVTWQSIEW